MCILPHRQPIEMMDMRPALVLLALAILPSVHADDWPSPQIREVFSSSRNYFVRVTPGKSWDDTFGFSGAPKGPFATAEFYLESDRSYRLITTVSLVNPVAPVDFFVTDRGFLVTLDNWHNRGYGKVAAFYSSAYQLLRAHELSDLFTETEIDAFSHSMSSILWWKATGAYVRADQATLYVPGIAAGSEFTFEIATAAYQFCEERNTRHLCRISNTARTWWPCREQALHRHRETVDSR
jgi:hypothetical protein